MKKLVFIAIICLATTGAQAQRNCVIDSKYILENLPEYKQAQTKLDEISATWQKEIDAKLQEVDRMYKSYQAEQVMLSDEMKLLKKKRKPRSYKRKNLVLKANYSKSVKSW
jgi:outer membrane protein